MAIGTNAKNWLAKHFLFFVRAKTIGELKQRLVAMDLSYEKALKERVQGARNKALTLIVFGALLVAGLLLFSDYLRGTGIVVDAIARFFTNIRDSILGALGIKDAFFAVTDFFYYLGVKVSDILFFSLHGTAIERGFYQLLGMVPLFLFFALLVFLNQREEKFWYTVLQRAKGEEEKKKKTVFYMIRPFLALIASLLLMEITVFFFGMIKCGSLVCQVSALPSDLGAGALQLLLLLGYYFMMMGGYYLTRWFEAKQLGFELAIKLKNEKPKEGFGYFQ